MEISVRTKGRSRELDYRFLGAEAPADFWWRQYQPVTDIERPTILLRSDGTSWQAYIAGIRSSRMDVTDNSIQFNLALDGDCGTGADHRLALNAVVRSAADLAADGGRFIPGGPLDARLPEATVDDLLLTPTKESAVAAADAVRAAYDGEAPAGPLPADQGQHPGGEGDWIGGLLDDQALAAFAALADRLLGGEPGRVVALNLVESDTDLAGLPEWDGVLGVLAARPGPGLEMGVRPLGKGGPPAAEATTGPASRVPRVLARHPLTAALAAAGALAGLAILIVWLTGNLPR